MVGVGYETYSGILQGHQPQGARVAATVVAIRLRSDFKTLLHTKALALVLLDVEPSITNGNAKTSRTRCRARDKIMVVLLARRTAQCTTATQLQAFVKLAILLVFSTTLRPSESQDACMSVKQHCCSNR